MKAHHVHDDKNPGDRVSSQEHAKSNTETKMNDFQKHCESLKHGERIASKVQF